MIRTLSHRKGSRSSTVLGFDDLVTAELDTVDECVALFLVGENFRGLLREQCASGEYESRIHNLGLGLREEGHDGSTRVTANNRDGVLGSIFGLADNGSDKGRRADNVQVSHTKEPAYVSSRISKLIGTAPGFPSNPIQNKLCDVLFRVKDTSLLQSSSKDGHGRVDGVGNDQDERLGASLGDRVGERLADTGINVEQVVASHAGLAGDTGRDDDNVGAFESLFCAVVGRQEALNLGRGSDVGEIGGHLVRVSLSSRNRVQGAQPGRACPICLALYV